MRVEKKTYKDGTKKLYATDTNGNTQKIVLIGKISNIIKHI